MKKNRLAEEVKGLKNEVCVWKSKVLDEMMEKEVVRQVVEMERGKVAAVERQLARVLAEEERERGREREMAGDGRGEKERKEREGGRKRKRDGVEVESGSGSESESESGDEGLGADGDVSMDGAGNDC